MPSRITHIRLAQQKAERLRAQWKHSVRTRRKNKRFRHGQTASDFSRRNWNPGKRKDSPIRIEFPDDVRFVENIEKFNNLISRIIEKCRNSHGISDTFEFDLLKVSKLDYPAINIMLTLVNYLNINDYNVRGSSPVRHEAFDTLRRSGFYSMVRTNRRVRHFDDHFFTLTGNNLTNERAISAEIRDITSRLTGSDDTYQPLYNTLGEIAANSVEHANGDIRHKNWFMSVHHENGRAVIMMADIGKGILGTLNLMLKQEIYNIVTRQNKIETLQKLFDGAYQSSTREPNRNNGLPDMMGLYRSNFINNVIVVTNEAVFDFSGKKSRQLNNPFPGTFYIIEVTKDNIEQWRNRQH